MARGLVDRQCVRTASRNGGHGRVNPVIVLVRIDSQLGMLDYLNSVCRVLGKGMDDQRLEGVLSLKEKSVMIYNTIARMSDL